MGVIKDEEEEEREDERYLREPWTAVACLMLGPALPPAPGRSASSRCLSCMHGSGCHQKCCWHGLLRFGWAGDAAGGGWEREGRMCRERAGEGKAQVGRVRAVRDESGIQHLSEWLGAGVVPCCWGALTETPHKSSVRREHGAGSSYWARLIFINLETVYSPRRENMKRK